MTQVALPLAANDGSPFDQIMEIDHDGSPVWRARRLMTLMGYPRWSDFQRVLERAMAAAKNTGNPVAEVFRRSPENPSGQGGRPREDFKLTRFAAYLVAMNGDPNKVEVAQAQQYFAIKTHEAETAAQIATRPSGDELDLIEGMLRALRADRQRITAIESHQRELSARMDGIEGLHDWFSALAYAKMNGLSTERSFLQRLGTAAGRITRREGLQPKPTQHALYGTVNTYPLRALDEAAELLVKP